jgi:hypothetical protein
MSLGFRIKSGYAVVVVLEGSRDAPVAVARHLVDLSDPDVPETRQPYHSGFGREEEDAREIAGRIGIVKTCAARAITALLRAADRSGRERTARPRNGALRAGLVVGSVIDPQQVANPHIRAHASEGKLFRTVVEDALHAHGVSCTIFLEKQLKATAAATLARDDASIRQTLTGFGKSLNGPWRAEEKAAAIAAWLAMR